MLQPKLTTARMTDPAPRVVESTRSEDDMRALFHDEVKPRLARETGVGAYNQEI